MLWEKVGDFHQNLLVFKDVDSLTNILGNTAGLIARQAEIRERLTHHFNLRLKEYSMERDRFLQLVTREVSYRD